ncbi:MAG: IS1634 family transposase [Deltaproteobacteria bacterium]|nr:IS1634 family transposase [Deltaproteobacteria bacterium]
MYKDKVYENHYLRRTYREDGKVKHETLGNLSHLPGDVIEFIRARLSGEADPWSGSGGFQVLRSFPHGHVSAVLGAARSVGLENLIAARPSRERDLVTAMVVMRVLAPASKLATARSLREATATTSLPGELGLDEVTDEEMYTTLDWLLERQARIEDKLAERHLQDGSLVLYDVSSSYYTGTHCPLARRGHSRDGKKGFPQIVYGLLCDAQGCPVAIEVFEGNTGDPKTLAPQIEKITERFGIKHIILVGDRGMITKKRIDEELRDLEGLDWVTALRADSIRKLVESETIQLSVFDNQDLAEVRSPDYPGERLVVCHNPLLAEKRRRKRIDMIEATEKRLDAIVAATTRARRPLRGEDKIGERVGREIGRYKMRKHFTWTITDQSFSYQRNEERIAEEAALDGLYVVRTSVPEATFNAEQVVSTYKSLSNVERAFRSLKTVDLKIRPIYHRLEDRVRAHVFLCMLAYYVEWHMREKLAPILFDDEDAEYAETLRASAVAPAQRSPRAKHKDRTKRTEEGLPVHSFRSLLADLTTLAKNLVTIGNNGDTFCLNTHPTRLQRKAFDLLGVTL